MARRVAMRFSAQNAFDYIELTPKYAIVEIETPKEWEGRTVAEVDVRRRYNVNILGLKTGDEIIPLAGSGVPVPGGRPPADRRRQKLQSALDEQGLIPKAVRLSRAALLSNGKKRDTLCQKGESHETLFYFCRRHVFRPAGAARHA